MSARMDAVALHAAGFTHLVSVIPPDATLAPGSGIVASSRGKVPGIRRDDGTWVGYAWRTTIPNETTVREWALAGANVGLATQYFPAVDIDCLDAALAADIADVARRVLGPAPERTGRAPKRLLLYRTTEPFTKGRLLLMRNDEKHLVEVLGDGQQCVILGVHPVTKQPYHWAPRLPGDPTQLTTITAQDVRLFMDAVAELAHSRGWTARRGGAGLPGDVVDDAALRAPSMTALAELVGAIPNTNESHPSRDSYLDMGYAIKAAAGADREEDGFAIFAEWASRWEGNWIVPGNDPVTVREDWRRMVPPYRIGWPWVQDQAKAHGVNVVATEFTASAEPSEADDPLFGTDHWLADRMVHTIGAHVRHVPELGRWYAWTGALWAPDAVKQTEAMVHRQLVVEANRVARMGASDTEKKRYYGYAERFLSAKRASAVRSVMESHPDLAIRASSFDANPWEINTPGGIIDLRRGTLRPSDPTALCSRATSVPPEFGATCPTWLRFLHDCTGGDAEFIGYLQRFAGYALTGLTIEQCLMFLWGPGGNGKSVFLNVLTGIAGDYATIAASETFINGRGFDRHSTEVASLAGARIVTASEVEHGRAWHTTRVKSLTGGEPVTARFMRQDNFTFTPAFKLCIAGNARPQIANLDDAMRRRLHLVPFTRKPSVVDRLLPEKLRHEYPAILAWMVEGCLRWQQHGLTPPAAIVAATEGYFSDEDAIGRWQAECCEMDYPDEAVPLRDLFQSWSAWCRATGEVIGAEREFAMRLAATGLELTRAVGGARVRVVKGLRLRPELALADLL